MFRTNFLPARLRSRLTVFVALLGVIALLPATAWASGSLAPCDPNYVFHFGRVWLVLPTGSDDTSNIQCAFDHAATEHGSTLLLTAGTYYTGQIAVFDFVGTFRGLGRDDTIIKTLDRTLQVAPLNFFENPPTPENGVNPWPSIFAFVGGDVVISDLSFYSTPNVWTTGWTWTGLGVTVYELAHAFVVVGPVVPGQDYTEANAALYRVRIEGVTQPGTLYGYDPISAIYYEGFFGAPYGQTLPLRGKFDAHDSEFRHFGGGTNLYNLYGSQVSITGNRYKDSFEGMDIGGAVNTVYEYANNEVFNSSAWGLNIYGPFTSSTLLVKNNVITGLGMGLYLDDTVTFAGDMKCRLLKNAVENVSDVGIYLGQGVTDCLVLCKSPHDTVKNLGTDNKLVGCHAVTAGETMKEGIRSRLHRKP
jgi:hypothetical protein